MEKLFYKVTDVADKKSVQDLIDFTMEKFGRIDVLYNNAGIMPREFLADAKFSNWEKKSKLILWVFYMELVLFYLL